MPIPLLNAYLAKLERLRAEEQRSSVNALVAAEGRALKDSDYERYMATLEATTQGRDRPRPVKPTARDLAMMGIRVVQEPTAA